MKTALFSLVLFLAMTSVASNIVCTPEMCLNTKCDAVTAENCAGKIVPHSGFCGCCDACYTIIKAGESCLDLIIPEHLLGVPPAEEVCDDGLTCNPITATCEAVAGAS